MNLRQAIRKRLPASLVATLKEQTGAPDMMVSLRKLREKGFQPEITINIGAYSLLM